MNASCKPFVTLVALVMVLAGCTLPSGPTSAPPATISTTPATLTQNLTALRDSGASLGLLLVDPNRTYAWVVRDRRTEFLSFPERLGEPRGTDLRLAVVDWSVVEPSRLASQIQGMTADCSPDRRSVSVDAITKIAYVARAVCEAPSGTRLTTYLNQQPLPAISTQWTAQDWQHLIDEWAAMSPSSMLGGVYINVWEIETELAPADGTRACRTPTTSRSPDGTNMTFSCGSTDATATPFSIKGLTGEKLATAAKKGLAELGATFAPHTYFSLDAPRSGGIRLTVGRGEDKNEQILAP